MTRLLRRLGILAVLVLLSSCSIIGGDDDPPGLVLDQVKSADLIAGRIPADLPTEAIPGVPTGPNLLDVVALGEPQEDALGRMVVPFILRNNTKSVAYGPGVLAEARTPGEETFTAGGQVVPGKIDPGGVGIGRAVFAENVPFSTRTVVRVVATFTTSTSKYFTVLGVEDYRVVDNSERQISTDHLTGTVHNPTRQPTSTATVLALCLSATGKPLTVFTAKPEPPLVPPRATARFDTPLLPTPPERCASYLVAADAGGSPEPSADAADVSKTSSTTTLPGG